MNNQTSQFSKTLSQEIQNELVVFEKITPSDWIEKPNPDKWSRIEILGHLIDSALNNIHRFIRIQQNDQTNIFYDQDFWVKAGDYQSQDAHTTIELWKLVNFQIANVWQNTPDNQLAKTIPVKDENPSLLFLMEDYIDHLKHHLEQISK